MQERKAAGKAFKYTNQVYGCPVVTRQEIELMFPLPATILESAPDRFRVSYDIPEVTDTAPPSTVPANSQPSAFGQLKLFD